VPISTSLRKGNTAICVDVEVVATDSGFEFKTFRTRGTRVNCSAIKYTLCRNTVSIMKGFGFLLSLLGGFKQATN